MIVGLQEVLARRDILGLLDGQALLEVVARQVILALRVTVGLLV